MLGFSRSERTPTPIEWLDLTARALQLAVDGTPPRAQLLQDVWVVRRSGEMRNGFFVEIGAADGLYLSNTYLLEKAFGWRGVLCEPNPSFAEHISERGRSGSQLVAKAVTPRSGDTVTLEVADERSKVVSQHRRALLGSRRQTVVQVATISPTDLLLEAGAPSVVDYLSVDTEGSEPEILRAWPWTEHSVRFLTVEHNHVSGRLAQLDLILLPRGFVRVLPEWSGVDAWYVHRDES